MIVKNKMGNKRQGFTLIELLIAISIIGVLVTLLVSNFLGIRLRSSDLKKKQDLQQMKKALRLYYNDHQSYPEDVEADIGGKPKIVAPGSEADPSELLPGAEFVSENGGVYMLEVPEYEEYIVSDDGEMFMIAVLIDNKSDQDAAESIENCNYDERVGAGKPFSTGFSENPATVDPGQYYLVCSE